MPAPERQRKYHTQKVRELSAAARPPERRFAPQKRREEEKSQKPPKPQSQEGIPEFSDTPKQGALPRQKAPVEPSPRPRSFPPPRLAKGPRGRDRNRGNAKRRVAGAPPVSRRSGGYIHSCTPWFKSQEKHGGRLQQDSCRPSRSRSITWQSPRRAPPGGERRAVSGLSIKVKVKRKQLMMMLSLSYVQGATHRFSLSRKQELLAVRARNR